MAYQPPNTIWKVEEKLGFNEPLDIDDPRFVPTEEGRGEFRLTNLFRTFGVDSREWQLKFEPERIYAVFCGHRGCGKSTELRRLSHRLHAPDLFFVVFLDVLQELDANNLQYAEILMAQAKALFDRLEKAKISVDTVFLKNLESWFTERVEQNEQVKDFAAEIKAGASVESGIPFFGKLFAGITNSFKVNSTHKETLRQIVKNSFSQFAAAFNQLLLAVEEEIRKNSAGRKLLFIVDGTDRLSDADGRRFFISDSHQLQLVESNFIYCAPIHLLYEGNQLQASFRHFILPMVKIRERTGEPNPEGIEALRKLVLQRADESLFDDPKTIDRLIDISGGNPRELLKLLHYCFQFAEGDLFDSQAAEKAVSALATDYRRILDMEDYQMLCEIDRSELADVNSERARHLLYNLALLEYNTFWWQTHPAIRTLLAYIKCMKKDEDEES